MYDPTLILAGTAAALITLAALRRRYPPTPTTPPRKPMATRLRFEALPCAYCASRPAIEAHRAFCSSWCRHRFAETGAVQ